MLRLGPSMLLAAAFVDFITSLHMLRPPLQKLAAAPSCPSSGPN
jgi:hypothetical protein